MQSQDVIGSNTQKIARLFPNCVTERLGKDGKPELAIDFEKLQAELSNEIIAEGEERYQFTWPDKRASVRLANTPTTMTLRPCREESVDFDNTQNLYIEGDNLDVLKVLRETYLGKVKMIYIDPPYNTGNDFVYNDDFSIGREEFGIRNGFFDEEGNQTTDPMQRNTESNGRFHTDWLNMIYPRLKVARDLLSEDGVIFISIDDNEVENLKKVCDELFGAANWINTICVNMNSLSGVKMTHVIKGKRFPAQKEYLLMYKKGGIQPVLSIEKKPKDKWDKEYNMIVPELVKGQYEAFSMMEDNEINNVLSKMHLMSLVDYCKKENITLTEDWKFSNSYRIFGTKSNRSLAKKVKDLRFPQQIVGYTNSDGNKRFFRTDYNKETKDPRIELVQAASTLEVFISDNWVDISNDGGVAQEGGVIYPNGKKPLQLINRIVKTCNTQDGIFLDFFAGSSTTAHSVISQNVLDGGCRKFVMVQYPENLDESLNRASGDDKDDIISLIEFCDDIKRPHYLTEIGKERIRRAGKKVKEEAGDKAENLDTGFRVLKLDSSNMEDVYYTPKEFSMSSLFNENVKADRTNEDLLFQVMLDLGIELSVSIRNEELGIRNDITVFNVDDGYLMAVFDKDVDEKTITEIAKRKPVYFVMRDASASNDNVIDNFEQIFKHYSPETTCRIV